MRRTMRLTERDLTRIVRRVIRENEGDIEEPYYTKSHGDPLEFYKNGMMQFALSVNLDDVPEVDWLRRKLDALTNEAEGKLSEEELRKLMSYRNKEIEPYIRDEEKRFRDDMNENEDIDKDSKKMDLKSDLRNIINYEYSEIEPSYLVEVLEELLHYAKNDVFRGKKPNKGYITKDEVLKNFNKGNSEWKLNDFNG